MKHLVEKVIHSPDFDWKYGNENVYTKMVPEQQTPEQKLREKQHRFDLKISGNSDESLKRVITNNEIWIYKYEIVLKLKSK